MNRRAFLLSAAAAPIVATLPLPPVITEQERVNAGMLPPNSYVYLPNRCIYVHGAQVIQWSAVDDAMEFIPLEKFYA